MLQMPAIVLSIILATLTAAIVYIWRGRGLRQWVAAWVAGLFGFFVAQWIAGALKFRFLQIGQVHPVEGIILGLLAAYAALRAVRRG